MTQKPVIESDLALVDIKDDALGVAPLAKRVAKSVVRMSAKDGLVIGLYGAWGSGKSTFINFIKQELSTFNENDKPVILNFNPWLFSNHEDLVQRYLVELSKILSPTKEKLKEYRFSFFKGISSVATVSEQLLTFAASLKGIPFVTDSVKAIGSLSQEAVKKLAEQEPLSEQKSKIENLLRKRKQKTLVIIDDLDRLEAREILDIFRMVKSVADFPNVIYLLSFDKKLVSNIIGNFQNSEGSDYLEKIVQYDIDLPFPSRDGIIKLFGEKIDPTIEEKGGKKWNKDRWSELYRTYLLDKLRMPRQAIRLSNSFNISYPALRGEVDPVDFLGIEALRMFNLEVYYEIRRNPENFIELGQNQYNSDKTDPTYFESVIQLVEEKDKENIKALLGLLFPRVNNAFSNFKSSTSSIAEWKAQARVCSSDHFARYFSYMIYSGQFSEAEMEEAIIKSQNLDQFENLIISYSKDILSTGKSRIPEFLERLLYIIKSGNIDAYLENIIKAFIMYGDNIIRKEDEDRSNWFRIDMDLRVLWIINTSMERLAKTKSVFDILKKAFTNSKSIHTVLQTLIYLGKEHGKYKEKKVESLRFGEPPYLTLEQLNKLEPIALKKVRQAAKNDTLLNNVKMHSILYRWRDILDNFKEPKAWVKKVSSTDEGLKDLLVKFSSISVISTMETTRDKINPNIDSIANFLDLDQTATRAEKILSDESLNKNEKEILEAFLKSYQNKKDGKSDNWDDD